MHQVIMKLTDLDYTQHASRLAEAHYQASPTRGKDALGFLLGGSGLFALKAVLSKQVGDQEGLVRAVNLFVNCCQEFMTPDPLGCGSDEVSIDFYYKYYFKNNVTIKTIINTKFNKSILQC